MALKGARPYHNVPQTLFYLSSGKSAWAFCYDRQSSKKPDRHRGYFVVASDKLSMIRIDFESLMSPEV